MVILSERYSEHCFFCFTAIELEAGISRFFSSFANKLRRLSLLQFRTHKDQEHLLQIAGPLTLFYQQWFNSWEERNEYESERHLIH